MIERIDALFVPLSFDQGLSPGEGSDMNRLTVARDGLGRLVLRGTSIAGVLRHGEERHAGENVARFWFGDASDDEDRSVDSLVQVDTALLETGNAETYESTHHLRNRHTGVVTNQGLFSIEICPPGTKTTLAIWVKVPASQGDQANEFANRLSHHFQQGIVFGGRSARGVGTARLAGAIQCISYDLKQPAGIKQYLAEASHWRAERAIPPGSRAVAGVRAESAAENNRLRVELRLSIPPGQDILISDAAESKPQRARHVDGEDYWILPGSSMRGAFKDWMTRLAALDNKPIEDSHQNFAKLKTIKDQTGHPKLDSMKSLACPINQLFGTVERPSRIKFTSALAKCSLAGLEQHRMHVAIDAVSGGAMDGRLFSNNVLTRSKNGASPTFSLTIEIADVLQHEADWLAKTIVSLHHGVLRIGSSKASGRIACEGIVATGAFHQSIIDIVTKYALTFRQ